MHKVVVTTAFLALATGAVAQCPGQTNRDLGYTMLTIPVSQLAGVTAWPECRSYGETDSRLPVRLHQYLAKERLINSSLAPRIADVCKYEPDIELYFIETPPVTDAPGVCHFSRYQLDPADVGGKTWRGVKIDNYYRQTFRNYMQMAKSCPGQRDKRYIPAEGISGGMFGTLKNYWQSAVRSPEAFRKTFSHVSVSGENSQVSIVTTVGELASATATYPENLRLKSISFDPIKTWAVPKTAYKLEVEYLRPSDSPVCYNPFNYKFYFDILSGKIVPLAIIEEH